MSGPSADIVGRWLGGEAAARRLDEKPALLEAAGARMIGRDSDVEVERSASSALAASVSVESGVVAVMSGMWWAASGSRS